MDTGIANKAGIGLRSCHIGQFASAAGLASWVEIHSENYLAFDSPRFTQLKKIRQDYPVSCHGVGLSLGTATGLDKDHLQKLRSLFDRIDPILVSEHLSWSVAGGVYLNDLLPLPYTTEALEIVVRNIDMAQEAFGRRILVENPSAYVSFEDTVIPEPEFLNTLAARTGCGLLLDVNNIYVTSHNTQADAAKWLTTINADAVGEYHVAGHDTDSIDGETVLVDTHGAPVCDDVWELFRQTVTIIGPRPTLIERDSNIPAIEALQAEAAFAQTILNQKGRRHAA